VSGLGAALAANPVAWLSPGTVMASGWAIACQMKPRPPLDRWDNTPESEAEWDRVRGMARAPLDPVVVARAERLGLSRYFFR
jgi:hypothetical protein